MYFVPLELVREIIESVFNDSMHCVSCDEPGRTCKPAWSSIESFTLGSKAYRVLALERWFRTLIIRSSTDLSSMQDLFPEIKPNWARELHCIQLASLRTQVWDLCGFNRLSKVRLDWLYQVRILHFGSEDPDRLPFTYVPSTVTELDIRGLPWPSPLIFYNTGMIFPNLEILTLRQQRIWCGLCHTCSVARFQMPGPEKIVYEGGLGLPMHYARAFCSLPHLHTVRITIPNFGFGHTILSDAKDHNRYLWAGECDRCMVIMYEDNVFRDRWVARKQGIRPGGGDTDFIYVRPPALRRVEWSFWSAEADEDPDEPGTAVELEDEDEVPDHDEE